MSILVKPGEYGAGQAGLDLKLARRLIDLAEQNRSAAIDLFRAFVEREGWKALGYPSLEACIQARVGEKYRDALSPPETHA